MPPELPSPDDERVDDYDYTARLREQAKQNLAISPLSVDDLSTIEIKHLAEELQIHQIELEMQNEALRESQILLERARDEYARLYHEAPIGYVTLDIENHIVRVNKTLAAMLNTRPEALRRRSFFDFVALENRDDFYLFQRRLQQGLEVPERVEILLITQDGDASFNAELRAAWQGESNQQEEAVMHLTISDITVRKQQEKTLIETQKLESLGLMAGGMAHIVNNMLASVMLNVELIQQKLGEEHPVYRQLAQINEHIDQELYVFKQLLDYTGNQRTDRTAVDLNSLIRESIPLFRTVSQHAHSRIQLELSSPADTRPLMVYGNSAQLQQLFINLISNAIEAYPTGHHEATIVIQTYFEDDHRVCIKVTDYGEGIVEENIDRIFDPFFTTKFLGRGLGLAATAGIVKSYKGDMSVQSRAGIGTSIYVYLPAHQLPKDDSQPSPSVAQANDGDALSWAADETAFMSDNCILIVDDQQELTEVVAEVLSFAGYEPLICNNGTEGLAMFKKVQRHLTAVLLDLTMPDIAGSEVMAQMRHINADIPIIIMTGFNQAEIANRLRDLDPPAAYLIKPVPLNTLLSTIEQVVSAVKE